MKRLVIFSGKSLKIQLITHSIRVTASYAALAAITVYLKFKYSATVLLELA